MVLIFILMFGIFAINKFHNPQKGNPPVLVLYYINLMVAIVFFYMHATSHLNISF